MSYTMNRGAGQTVARMATRWERYPLAPIPRDVPELPVPVPVPDIRDTYLAAGGRMPRVAFTPAPINAPAPWADCWADGR